jgi:hypothetical protein
MNAETKMAQRLVQVIEPRQAARLPLTPDVAEERENLKVSQESDAWADWNGLANLIGADGHGVRELASPLSD